MSTPDSYNYEDIKRIGFDSASDIDLEAAIASEEWEILGLKSTLRSIDIFGNSTHTRLLLKESEGRLVELKRELGKRNGG